MQKSPDERKHTSKTGKFQKITWKIRLVGIWKKEDYVIGVRRNINIPPKLFDFCSRFMDDAHEK